MTDDTRPSHFPPASGTLDRSLTVVRFLREHCEWDRSQTAESLLPYLLEEAAEVALAIRSRDAEALVDELGDLLLNVAFQVVVAEESGRFTAQEVASSLEAKMKRRHPHLFRGGVHRPWAEIKAEERAKKREPRQNAERGGEPERGGLPERTSERLTPSTPPEAADPLRRSVTERSAQPGGLSAVSASGSPSTFGSASAPGAPSSASGPGPGCSLLDSVPSHRDPLDRSQAIQTKVAEIGFDWPDPSGAAAKMEEELQEVCAALAAGDEEGTREELGDLLFSVVNLSRLLGVHASDALSETNAKFERRFRSMEAMAAAEGATLHGRSLDDLDVRWERAKALERAPSSRKSDRVKESDGDEEPTGASPAETPPGSFEEG